MEPITYSVAQLAEALRCTRAHVYKMAKDGLVRLRYDRASAYIDGPDWRNFWCRLAVDRAWYQKPSMRFPVTKHTEPLPKDMNPMAGLVTQIEEEKLSATDVQTEEKVILDVANVLASNGYDRVEAVNMATGLVLKARAERELQ